MSVAAVRLRAIHSGPQPLIMPNVCDPVSARAFADAGFAALATSSSAAQPRNPAAIGRECGIAAQ